MDELIHEPLGNILIASIGIVFLYWGVNGIRRRKIGVPNIGGGINYYEGKKAVINGIYVVILGIGMLGMTLPFLSCYLQFNGICK